ncbi:hypothetical protein [Stenoxybacter acetivorans]|uniref:hypothetical protein n=1 Tax=Stenoxybacter acetivorans TaxID=422441 RepID=UPI00056CDED7|nr:hypothetical protein [Stenoxybacter acetivorans]
MKKILLLCSAAALLLSACAGNNAPIMETAAYNPQTQARIRLYGQNQKPAIMFFCQGNKPKKVNTGGSFSDALGSFAGTADSHSIGIAQTDYSRAIAEQNGILSKALYREYVIPADKPINVSSHFLGLTNESVVIDFQRKIKTTTTMTERNCRKGGSFIPQAGHDYEVQSLTQGRVCTLEVVDITDPQQALFEPLTEPKKLTCP